MTNHLPPRPIPPASWWLALIVVLSAAALAIVAWRGWESKDPLLAAKQQAEAEAKEKDDETKRKDADPRVDRLVVQPGVAETEQQFVKPGHWTTGSRRMQAMYQDFVGQLRTVAVNGRGEIYTVEGTPTELESTRPVVLAKGQPKEIDTTFLVPNTERNVQIRSELLDRGFGRSTRLIQPVTRMPAYQYYLVILAREPTKYAFVKTLDSVVVPWDGETEADDTEDPIHYRVVALESDRTIALPDNPLTWTSIAYVLWDDVDPKRFSSEQARAVVDWLHWGGQLVISGPDSLDLLRSSFLEPYLPATSGGSREIAATNLAELNRHWLIDSPQAGGALAPVRPWVSIELVEHDDAAATNSSLSESTGGLLVERPVGRGRIVVSAMQLSERELVNWQGGFQSLFNSGILGRPHRVFRPGYFEEVSLAWADPALAERRLDGRLTTGLRILARDWNVDANYRVVDLFEENLFQPPTSAPTQLRELRPPLDLGGISAWNNFSPVADAARESLVKAAGVEVPDTSFVIACLALYLLALVPLNWIVFNAIGRVELAWIAAPLIALAGTWVIVDRARLDIGFVRAQTEVGVLELQPNYERGHFSRYTALYTSLSTTYDLRFDEPTALAAPFPTTSVRMPGDVVSTGTNGFERFDGVSLSGVFVPSNTTNMIHSEQMLQLEGAIRLGESSLQRTQVENRSQLDLRSVAIVERVAMQQRAGEESELRGAWIGDIPARGSVSVAFTQRITASNGDAPFADQRRTEAGNRQQAANLDLEPMFRLAFDAGTFEPGEKRLVGRIDDMMPGQAISPAASQVQGATVVVVHLQYAPRPAPRPDLNTARDVPRTETDPDEERFAP